ncbi:MAG: hypothetical protein QM765_51110 [Myxococcales bacterium]
MSAPATSSDSEACCASRSATFSNQRTASSSAAASITRRTRSCHWPRPLMPAISREAEVAQTWRWRPAARSARSQA